MSDEILIVTLYMEITPQDWVYHELEQAFGKPVKIFDTLDSVNSNEQIQQALAAQGLAPGVPCALLYADTGRETWGTTSLSFFLRATSVLSAMLQNVPIMIALHTRWDEDANEFIRPDGAPFTIKYSPLI